MSSQLIAGQESEKRRLARELHEGIAQALCSIKFRLEHAGHLLSARQPMASLLQQVIAEVRALAMELRPPSLDEIGVLATLNWYQRELQEVHPDLALRLEGKIKEDDIPPPVKVVLYRALQQMLQFLVRNSAAADIRVMLNKTAADAVRLEVSDDRSLSDLDAAQREVRELHLLTLREFIVLSGGEMEVRVPNGTGGTTVCAEWPA